MSNTSWWYFYVEQSNGNVGIQIPKAKTSKQCSSSARWHMHMSSSCSTWGNGHRPLQVPSRIKMCPVQWEMSPYTHHMWKQQEQNDMADAWLSRRKAESKQELRLKWERAELIMRCKLQAKPRFMGRMRMKLLDKKQKQTKQNRKTTKGLATLFAVNNRTQF